MNKSQKLRLGLKQITGPIAFRMIEQKLKKPQNSSLAVFVTSASLGKRKIVEATSSRQCKLVTVANAKAKANVLSTCPSSRRLLRNYRDLVFFSDMTTLVIPVWRVSKTGFLPSDARSLAVQPAHPFSLVTQFIRGALDRTCRLS